MIKVYFWLTYWYENFISYFNSQKNTENPLSLVYQAPRQDCSLEKGLLWNSLQPRRETPRRANAKGRLQKHIKYDIKLITSLRRSPGRSPSTRATAHRESRPSETRYDSKLRTGKWTRRAEKSQGRRFECWRYLLGLLCHLLSWRMLLLQMRGYVKDGRARGSWEGVMDWEDLDQFGDRARWLYSKTNPRWLGLAQRG